MATSAPPPPSLASTQSNPSSVNPIQSREPHLLSLKVLRAARPSLVPSLPHLYYEKTSFGGDQIRALNDQFDGSSVNGDGNGIEKGALENTLMLPSTFGSADEGGIYLLKNPKISETFSALLSLSNDCDHPTSSISTSSFAINPSLKVEIHTNPAPNAPPGIKHHLKTITLPTSTSISASTAPLTTALVPMTNESTNPDSSNVGLGSGQSLEALVSHEIKELVTHSLVCTVTYGVDAIDQQGKREVKMRSFRKVYKFQVANPLSVRTKAHSPSPHTASSSLSSTERSKVFLEVQVQNQGEHSMTFERMRFDPVPGWSVVDPTEGLFRGSEALLGPGAVRQYLYILNAGKEVARVEPGGSQGLGRLDIVWRTPGGEVGRLQTSMLGRRIPLPPTSATSTVPSGPGAKAGLSTTIRGPLPPALVPNEGPATPIKSNLGGPTPYRRSPKLNGSSPEPTISSSPHQYASNTLPPPPPPLAALYPDTTGLSFDLTTKVLTNERSISRQTPFEVEMELSVTYDPFPSIENTDKGQGRRRLKLCLQHVHHTGMIAPNRAKKSIIPSAILSVPGGQNTIQSVSHSTQQQQRSSQSTPRSSFDHPPTPTITAKEPIEKVYHGVIIPPPVPTSVISPNPYRPSSSIQLLGTSLIHLPDLVLSAPKPILASEEGGGEGIASEISLRPGILRARMKFVSVGPSTGIKRVGGVRILLIDNADDSGLEEEEEDGEKRSEVKEGRERRAKIVGEWDVVAEVLIGS